MINGQTVYVLEHVKHVMNKALGHPVDSHQWVSVYEQLDEACFAGAEYAKAKGLLGTDPIYVWWTMHPVNGRAWWLSNEFGPNNNNVGNSLRVVRFGAQS